MALAFSKWEGTGNDFVVFDGSQSADSTEGVVPSTAFLPSGWSNEQVALMCDRHRGVGSDGLVVVRPHESGGIEVDFRNPDGSRSFCGNGTRVALAYAQSKGWISESSSRQPIHAVDGQHWGRIREDGTPGITVLVSNPPRFMPPHGHESMAAAWMDTGSPHHVEWLLDRSRLEALDVVAAARPIRHHASYAPGGTNVNFVALGDHPESLHIRTFERGVEAETLSCGTGVVAAAWADLVRVQHSGSDPNPSGVVPIEGRRVVHARGGVLEVEVSPGSSVAGSSSTEPTQTSGEVWLFGKARQVFQGWWIASLVLFAWLGMPHRQGVAAQDGLELWSEATKISVLTASPGQDVYAAFGHTAIRVQDPLRGVDLVYNYGTFTVDEGFYLRFVRGRMDYKLSVESYPRFQHLYLRQGRALLERPLLLQPEQVLAVIAYLQRNALPEHAVYSYDFFRDNCASKVIEVLQSSLGEGLDVGCALTDDKTTYLEALRPYIHGIPWTAWGMELILGWEAMRDMPPCGHAFLPDVLDDQLGHMTFQGQPLAGNVREIFPAEGSWFAGVPSSHAGGTSPTAWMWIWAMWSLCCAWMVQRNPSRSWRRLIRLTWGLSGVVGTLLTALFLAMAIATDHSDTWWNPDMVWASLGPWVLWGLWRERTGPISGDNEGFRVPLSNTIRTVMWGWMALGLISVAVVPWLAGSGGWLSSVVWPSLGLSVAMILAVGAKLGERYKV
ncbi:MAG: diaminopimelate epimerase [Bacteroidetes bacterium]|nr:diaminopimelate epimerase [Bacteroidota bacterium]MDA0904345.1 diaminopimelate epimerase [Bacteroidota bacterium]MDA1243106.1 diaminopimelate epimerase [Bacteroidota bacterium]